MVLLLVPDAAQRVSGAPQIRDRYGNVTWRSRVCSSSLSAALRPGNDLKLHARRLFELGKGFSEIEKRALRKAKSSVEERRGELLDARVVFLHRVVEEAA